MENRFGAAIIIAGDLRQEQIHEVLSEEHALTLGFASFANVAPALRSLLLLASNSPRIEEDDSDRLAAVAAGLARIGTCRVYVVRCWAPLVLNVEAFDPGEDLASWQRMGLEGEGNLQQPFDLLNEELELTLETLGLDPRAEPPLVPNRKYWRPVAFLESPPGSMTES